MAHVVAGVPFFKKVIMLIYFNIMATAVQS